MFCSVRMSCFNMKNPRLLYSLGNIPTAAAVRTYVCAVTAVKTQQLSVVTECGQVVTLVTKCTRLVRANRAVRTSPQVLTLKARLLQVSRAVHRRPCG